MQKVSVVIPTFNGQSTIRDCLHSLFQSDYSNIEVVVVDNASIDNTVQLVSRYFPTVRIIQESTNRGIAAGRNKGFSLCKGDLIFFVDQDNVIDHRTISSLVKSLNSQELGAAGPAIYYLDDPKRLWSCGTKVSLLTGKVEFVRSTKQNVNSTDVPFEAEVLPAPFLLRREAGMKAGLFDETFFAVFEDSDFFHRIRRTGYTAICVPRAKAWHKVPTNSKAAQLRLMERSYYVGRNRILFIRRNSSLKRFTLFLLFFAGIFATYYSISALRYKRIDWLRSYWSGTKDAFTVR